MVGAEEAFQITMTLDDIHDLEPVLLVAEENHIAPEGDASDVRAQLWSRPAEFAGQ